MLWPFSLLYKYICILELYPKWEWEERKREKDSGKRLIPYSKIT